MRGSGPSEASHGRDCNSEKPIQHRSQDMHAHTYSPTLNFTNRVQLFVKICNWNDAASYTRHRGYHSSDADTIHNYVLPALSRSAVELAPAILPARLPSFDSG